MPSEQEAVPDTGKLDSGLTIVRVLIAALAILPILPFCLIFAVGSAIPANSNLEAAVFGISRIVTLLSSSCAALLMPVLIGIGILLARTAHKRTGKPYPTWLFILTGIVWIAYIAVTVALFMIWFVGN
ncbi:MAG: hypothetical protein JXB30_04115 [Anaerolineae bacterium]|nr:hypothetical protein [Anaerolineae bacterium]